MTKIPIADESAESFLLARYVRRSYITESSEHPYTEDSTRVMVSHLYCLATIHAVRGLAGLAVAVLFLYYSDPSNVPANHLDLTMSRFHNLEGSDPAAFLVVGCVLVVLGLARLGFACLTLISLIRARGTSSPGKRAFRFMRPFGLAVALVDVIDLTFFPVTTACGLYGWMVFRHADTRDFFEGRLASV